MRRKTFPILAVATLLFGVFAFSSTNNRYFEIAKNLDIFATLFKEVNTFYVDEIDPNTLIKTGIDAMLLSLDPYTNYIPEDDIEDFRTLTTGQYGGIGSLIGTINGRTVITMPHDGYPAQKAGIKIGDEIVGIDGVDVEGRSSADISKLLKGQAKTPVKLTVKRFGQSQPIEFSLMRERITIDNVSFFDMVEPEIGYIKLTDFTTGAGKEVADALKSLKERGAKSIILDLRGNPGGLLSEAINVSNVFVPKGAEVVSTKGKIVDWNKTYNALNNAVDTKIPLAVLTDRGSASAAEIVSGVIQDYDRGVLVGARTFGKGLVQASRPLTYNSQLKVTTAKYYIPSGRCIQAIDYSNRNADGSVGKIPDSLKVAFTTRNGREVFDGGGLYPDFKIEEETYAPISISLVSKGLIFNYATEYFFGHKSIAKADEFELDNQSYEEFVQWLGDKDYDYETRLEKKLDEMVVSAKEEKYYSRISDEIASLQQEIEHNKEKDLHNFQEEIKELLEAEIVSRYYLQEGEIRASLQDDADMKKAVAVLQSPELYKKTLGN